MRNVLLALGGLVVVVTVASTTRPAQGGVPAEVRDFVTAWNDVSDLADLTATCSHISQGVGDQIDVTLDCESLTAIILVPDEPNLRVAAAPFSSQLSALIETAESSEDIGLDITRMGERYLIVVDLPAPYRQADVAPTVPSSPGVTGSEHGSPADTDSSTPWLAGDVGADARSRETEPGGPEGEGGESSSDLDLAILILLLALSVAAFTFILIKWKDDKFKTKPSKAGAIVGAVSMLCFGLLAFPVLALAELMGGAVFLIIEHSKGAAPDQEAVPSHEGEQVPALIGLLHSLLNAQAVSDQQSVQVDHDGVDAQDVTPDASPDHDLTPDAS